MPDKFYCYGVLSLITAIVTACLSQINEFLVSPYEYPTDNARFPILGLRLGLFALFKLDGILPILTQGVNDTVEPRPGLVLLGAIELETLATSHG